MFANPMDPNNCFVDINAGQGGTEAQDWAQMLLRMYLKYCDKKGFRAEILEQSDGEVAGLKSATIKIEGLLGQEFLSHFDYLLDLKEGRLEFGSLDHPLHDGARTHFTMVEGRPVIATSLGKMVMDSGADAVVRFRVPGGATTRQLRTLTGMTAVGTVRSTLVIEQRKFWQGEAVAVPQPHESGVDGLLPLGLFDKVYVNNSESYVILE